MFHILKIAIIPGGKWILKISPTWITPRKCKKLEYPDSANGWLLNRDKEELTLAKISENLSDGDLVVSRPYWHFIFKSRSGECQRDLSLSVKDLNFKGTSYLALAAHSGQHHPCNFQPPLLMTAFKRANFCAAGWAKRIKFLELPFSTITRHLRVNRNHTSYRKPLCYT